MSHLLATLTHMLSFTLIDALSATCIVSSIGMYLCGIPMCLKIATVGNAPACYPAAPFLMGVVGCLAWLCYGLMRADTAVTVVNGVGLALEIAYMIFYWRYTQNRRGLNRSMWALAAVTLLVAMYINMTAASDELMALRDLGVVCMALNIANYAAPLAGLRDVLRSGTTACIPFELCVANFVVGTLWTLYGYFVDDVFLVAPNAIGVALALAQLSLFVYYPPSMPSPLPSFYKI